MGFTLNQLEQERQIRKLQKKEDKDTSDYEQLSNLPKVNNVELKGNKTTGDLGINADNVMMSDGVTSVEDAINTQRYETIKSVTADGAKTLSAMLDELYPYRMVGAILQVSDYAMFNTRYSTQYGCVSSDANGNPLARSAILKASGSIIKTYELATGTLSDQSAVVPSSGAKIELYIKL